MGDCVRSAVGGGLVKEGCVVDVFLTKPMPPPLRGRKGKNKIEYKIHKKKEKKRNYFIN